MMGTQLGEDVLVQKAHPTDVVPVDLAVLVTHAAAVAVDDGVAASAVVDVDLDVEFLTHGDLGLDLARVDALHCPLTFGHGGDNRLCYLVLAGLDLRGEGAARVDNGFAGTAGHGQQGQGDKCSTKQGRHSVFSRGFQKSQRQRRNTREVFTPPKAKLLFITYSLLICRNSPRR